MTVYKGLFLDRDGVVNYDTGYVFQVSEFKFMPGVFEFCLSAQKLGYRIIVVTNQAGIARGYYSESEFLSLTAWMEEEFRSRGIEIADTYYCPHHKDFNGACDCRKPAPGMILMAAQALEIDLEASVFIGDKPSDMLAASRAGVPNRWLMTEVSDGGSEYATEVWKNFDGMAEVLEQMQVHDERL
ncbi:MAG: hypothetical protein RJB63_192 [Actinomycetota bacterium]